MIASEKILFNALRGLTVPSTSSFLVTASTEDKDDVALAKAGCASAAATMARTAG